MTPDFMLGQIQQGLRSALDELREMRKDLRENYVPRSELEVRFTRLEHGPQRLITNALALISTFVWMGELAVQIFHK